MSSIVFGSMALSLNVCVANCEAKDESMKKESWEECRYFDCLNNACNAPICPLNPDSLKYCAWFPDEEICRKASVPEGVKIQRKIEKKSKNTETCYTWAMLNRHIKVSTGIAGVDPERITGVEDETVVREWIGKHPVIRERTAEEKAILQERGKVLQAKKQASKQGMDEKNVLSTGAGCIQK